MLKNRSKKNKNKVLFILDDDALVVANTGAGFSRKGVISICYMDLSAKHANKHRTPQDNVYGADDKELVASILQKRLKGYKNDINDLRADTGREDGVSASYGGRFVWELLQNADDATTALEDNNAQLIGAKGLGFKSVLEITDEPEIYSGDFHFHFSEQKSRDKLKEIPCWNEKVGIPVCRLPHPKQPDDATQKLLETGYTTVIRLPLKSGKREVVENKLSEFCNSWLLFCQSLELVEIRTNNDTRKIAVRRLENDGEVEITDHGNCEYWRIWRDKADVGDDKKKISVSMCLPCNDNGVKPCEGVPLFNVFFPTAEKVENVYAMVHASCELDPNRKHLLELGEQPHREKICRLMKDMTKEILSGIPAKVALQAFGKARLPAPDAKSEKMIDQLENAIAEAVRETAFVPILGGGKAKPEAIRLWKYGVGWVLKPAKVKNKNLCKPEINDDEGCCDILKQLGAEQKSTFELVELLRHCKNTNQKYCLDVWYVAQQLLKIVNPWDKDKEKCVQALRNAPFWWTTDGKARSLNDAPPLSLAKPKDCPAWLTVDVVDKNFAELINEEEKQCKEKNENWKNHLSACKVAPLANSADYFNGILLPYCENPSAPDWQKQGWKILKIAFKWGGKSGQAETLILGSGNAIEKRAKSIYLPVGKNANDWQPAAKCYAGKAWGGPGIFDKYFAGIEERYILSPAKAWQIDDIDIEKWKSLLSWLGCSWMPKMRQESERHPERTTPYNATKWINEFSFEHFDEMLKDRQNDEISNYLPLLDIAHTMFVVANENESQYKYHMEKYCQSYAMIQLHQNKWVPCERCLLKPTPHLLLPSQAYLPGCGLGELLPEVVSRRSKIGVEVWGEIEGTLKNLGIKDKISSDPDELMGYMNDLSKCANQENAELRWDSKEKSRSDIAHAAEAIFSQYANLLEPKCISDDTMVPCIRIKPQGEFLVFKEASEVRRVDKPYLWEAQVRQTILKTEELNVFFHTLKEGKGFGLKKLSKHLNMSLEHGDEDTHQTKCLRERYKERLIGLTKATGVKLPKSLNIVAYKGIHLQAERSVDIKPTILFWKKNEQEVHINAEHSSGKWYGLAAALDAVMDCGQNESAFEILLMQPEWENFVSRLRDSYNLPEESLNKLKRPKFQSPEVAEESEEIEDTAEASDSETDSSVLLENNRGNFSSHRPYGGTTGNSTHPPHRTQSTSHPSRGGVNAIPPEQSDEVPDLIEVDYDNWRPKRNSMPVSSGGQSTNDNEQSEREERGVRGERALLGWLKKKFGKDNVTDANQETPNNPGYDFSVEHNGDTYYYECKSSSEPTLSRYVTLTKTQFEKAKKEGEKYVLCVIYDVDSNPAKLLTRIANPTQLKSEPERYKLDISSRK